jgi:hypothetical protein
MFLFRALLFRKSKTWQLPKHVRPLVDQLMERFNKYELPNVQVAVVVNKIGHHETKGAFEMKLRLSVPDEPLYVAHSREIPGAHDGIYNGVG